jgi:Dolichyl-phosphate-mannose-protein mannosyltransferase
MISDQHLAAVTKRKYIWEHGALIAAVLWFSAVLFLKVKGTPRFGDELLLLIRDYQGFHLWHAYSAKGLVGFAAAFWIIWIAIKCGAQLLGKLLPAAELSPVEHRVFSAGLGFAAISLVTLLLGVFRLWYVSVFVFVLVVASIAYFPRKLSQVNWRKSIPAITPLKEWWAQAAFALLLVAGLILFIGDLAPEIFYDSLHYHLAVPNLYLLNHRIYNEPNFAYASFVMVVQMFWGFALTVGNEITVKLLHGAMTLLLFFAFVAFERRYLSQNAGLLGTLIFVSMPLVGFNATAAGIDVASSAMQFLAVFALTRALTGDDGEPGTRQWIRLAGLFTGVAATCKFTSLPTILIACIVIAWRRRQERQQWQNVFRQLALFLVYAALFMLPFYMKNVVFHHNPVYPIAGTVWGEPRVDDQSWNNIAMETAPPQLTRASSFLDLVVRFFRDPWFITMNGRDSAQNFIGPLVLGLLPLLLIVRPPGVACSVLAVYSIGLWVVWLLTTTAQVRFGMPLLAIVSLLLGHAVLSSRGAVAVRHALLVLCLLSASWNLYYTLLFTGLKDGWRVVGGMVSEHDYLAEQHLSYPTPDYEGLAWMNKNLPAGSKVMMVGDTRTYYTRIPVVPSSLFDKQPIVAIARTAQSGDQLAEMLRKKGVTHLFVNAAEAIRTEAYRPIQWDGNSWAVLDNFWRGHVRLIWSSVAAPPNFRALFVYEVRPDRDSSENSVPPFNPFERWKPR